MSDRPSYEALRTWLQQCQAERDSLRSRIAALEKPATITETRERITRLLDHLVELAVGDGEVEP